MEHEERLKAALADRYQIEREIGSGGMATVYLAEDLRHHRKVAVKVLRPDLAAILGPDRFVREIEIAATLNHPHILPLHDSGEADGFLYYVMPYVEGESLRQRLSAEGKLPIQDTIRILREVADALDEAHRRDVVHRDIKPANILLTGRHALVADFGVAKALSDATPRHELTTAGVALGTPSYMAPEQAAADAQTDHRADIFALGVIGYEMLSGEPPFGGETTAQILAALLTETPKKVGTRRDGVPELLERVVMRCLEKDPDHRWQAAQDLVTELEKLATPGRGIPSASGWVTPSGRGWVLSRLGAGAALLALLGIWFFGGRGDRRKEWARMEALPEARRLAEAGDLWGAFALTEEAAELIEGDHVLEELRNSVSEVVSITTEPPGADVFVREYGSSEDDWVHLGSTPIQDLRLASGVKRWRIEKAGFEEVLRVPFFTSSMDVSLSSTGSWPEGMVHVPGGRAFGWTAETGMNRSVDLPPHFYDRFEVSNREFLAFVDAGGYESVDLWPELSQGGSEPAIGQFVDATGRRGPATWEVGGPRIGSENLPVSGVSWHEALAYCLWQEKDLPTLYHWSQASGVIFNSAEVIPLSNFEGEALHPPGTLGGIGTFGSYDLGGNVREWMWNIAADGRLILGGAWNDPGYFFSHAQTFDPMDRSPGNGFRCIREEAVTDQFEIARGPVELNTRDYLTEEPVSDAAFEVFLRQFEYDPVALDAVVGEVGETPGGFAYEIVSFNAAYDGARVSALVMRPDDSSAPHDVVLVWPGSGAISSPNVLEMADPGGRIQLDFLLRDGHAVVVPVLKGTYERRDGLETTWPSETRRYRDYVVRWIQDVSRTLDYLESRPDVDSDRVAFLGISWGGRMGVILAAVEHRFRAAVLYSGGLASGRALPEVDQNSYVRRVEIPVLMLNGLRDSVEPYETAQLPLLELLGTPTEDKHHVTYPTGHLMPRVPIIRETTDWLRRYLGRDAGS